MLRLTTAPLFFSLCEPPAMKQKQHANMALLHASQAEFNKLSLAWSVYPKPEPCNEYCGGASLSWRLKNTFFWLRKHGVVGIHIVQSPVGNVSTNPSSGVINLNCPRCVGKSAITAPKCERLLLLVQLFDEQFILFFGFK